MSNAIIRKSADRGHSDIGWLNSRHSFSFADYYDPEQMGFHSLRVINEDKVAAGKGFGAHPHKSMEIFSYVVSGQLEHKDSLGNGSSIQSGEFQYMSAGRGVTHSEFNPSETKPAHFLQIWITPKEEGGDARYAERKVLENYTPNTLDLLASPDGEDGSMGIRQETTIHFGRYEKGQSLSLPTSKAYPHRWLQLIEGEARDASGNAIAAGDGYALSEAELSLSFNAASSFLLFSLS